MANSDNNSDSLTEEEIDEEKEYEEMEEEEIGEEEEEVENEEVEVEEAIEEEEAEIEEEEGDEGIAEKEEEAEDEEKTDDSSKGLESDKNVKAVDIIKSTPEEFETIIASTGKDVTDLTDNKEASNTSVSNILDKHIPLEESRSSKTSRCEKEIIENRTPDEIIEQVKNLSPQEVNNKESDKKNWMEVDFTLEKEGKVELDGSTLAPQKRPRSSTPVAELESSTKKTAIVCDFYSRGWCIKGNSCLFLHQKEINKESVAEPSEKENVLDGSGSQGESKSMSLLSSQEKPYSSKPLMQTKQDGHISTLNQTTKTELFNGSPLLRRCSSPIRNSATNDRCRLNGMLKSSNDYLNNTNHSLSPMNSRYNGFGKRYQSSGSSSLPKSSPSFFSKFTSLPSKFPAHLRCKVELDEKSWEPSVPFVPTYPYIINRLYPHEAIYDSRNVLTNTNVLNSSTNIDSRNADAHESYGQSSGAKCLLPKEEKHAATNNSIDVASANNNNEVVASANIVGGVTQGHGSNLKHGEGDMEVVSKESKEMKAFRVALIEFVKELVKPFWHEGRLTKDAHKKVVKKSVEKVICSIEVCQIPNENEAITQYLSINRPKLLKLVEAYVEKYSVIFQA